jgi:hypothetical protein
MLRFFILSILFLYFFHTTTAQRVVVLTDSTKEFIFKNDYLQILEDKDKIWTIEDVSKPDFDQKFIVNNSSYPYNEHINSTYWIRFKVKYDSRTGKRFLLESYAPHTNNWDLYVPEGSGYKAVKSGLSLNFYERDYINKNLILDLPLDGDKIQTFYVRVLSQSHSSFDYRIKPLRYFFFYSVNEYYFLGMYYGIMIIMAIYNFLIFISLREKVYIYYVFYVFCGILTSLADDGIGYQYVWGNSSRINLLVGAHIAPNLLLITFVLYSHEFLQIRKKYSSHSRYIIGVTVFYIFYYFLKLTVLPPKYTYHIFYLLPFVLVYYSAIKIYLNGYKPARFFIAGFGFILVSIVIIKLRSNGSIEGNLFTVYSLNYGLVLEVLVLSLALADRVKYDKQSKEKALRERNLAQYDSIKQLRINEKLKDLVNLELETKVEERTRELYKKNEELELSNRKLEEMTAMANQMSLKLDKDNWTLQQKVQDSIRDRMMGQEVSYEEFNKIFPNENACYRYLYELKWESSYECRKCRCKEFTAEEKLFSKKCSKCGYYESVTAHTLFHAIKFPINKAFYIAYLMIYQQDRMTLNRLCILLDLKKNTCWKFKEKVLTAIDDFNKLHKRKNTQETPKSWETIIFSKKKNKDSNGIQ